MKYLSLFLLIVLLSLTWNIAHKPATISEAVHVGLQEDIENIIANQLAEKMPDSKNLRFEKLWTEALKSNQVKASFTFSFDDPGANAARVLIDGYAILNRLSQITAESESWDMEVHILNNNIEFTEAITITPDMAK